MPHLAATFPRQDGAPGDAPFSHRQDLADIHRLLGFVQARRKALAAAGQSTADADALLTKLRREEAGVRDCLGERAG